LLIALVGIIVLISLSYNYFSSELDDISLNARQPSIIIRDVDSNLLASYGDLYSGYVPLKDISENLVNAVISIEDHRFYEHFGIDIRGILRALYVNLSARKIIQGGSTISQQLTKLLFLNPEKSFIRKIRELFITLKLEESISKDEILSLYLNRAYFGSGNYGVLSSSKNYFNKSPKNLDIHEAAMLAASLKAPSRLNPIVSIESNRERANLVVNKMHNYGYITQEERDNSIEKIQSTVVSKKINIQNRYFTDWVLRRSASYKNDSIDIEIKTTFDPQIQTFVEKAIPKIIKNVDLEIAVIVMDASGAIKAMLGGKSYYKSQFNRATQAKRQPGSVFKLFTYMAAFNSGLNPQDSVEDSPLDLNGWKPQNYNKKYQGEITLNQAFASSSNVAAVRIQEKVGRQEIINWAKRLGVSANLLPERSLTLGTQEISLIEMTNAYVSIVSGGKATFPHAVTEIKDKEGNTLYKRNLVSRDLVLNESICLSMRYILNYSILNGTARKGKPRNVNNNNFLLGGKTGTTQDSKDAWFIGYLNDMVVGVWVGRDDNRDTPGLYGGNQPALIFREIMEEVLNL